MKNRIAQVKEIKRRNEGEEFLQIICKIIETKQKLRTTNIQIPGVLERNRKKEKKKKIAELIIKEMIKNIILEL